MATNTINLVGIMDRVVALQIEAMGALTPAVAVDAKPYFWHVQESFPYFVNRLSDFGIEGDSEDLDTENPPIIMRLVLGHLTGSYEGENDAKLLTYIPQIIKHFNERELLQSAAFPTPIPDLERARVTNCTGYRQWVHSGVGGMQVGAEFTLRCEFRNAILQAYL